MPNGKGNKPPKPNDPPPPAPGKVLNVTASPINSTSVVITWGHVDEATEYYIYRDGNITGIVVFPDSYIDNNSVKPDTEYKYQVAASIGDRATHTNVFGEKSDPVTVRTPA